MPGKWGGHAGHAPPPRSANGFEKSGEITQNTGNFRQFREFQTNVISYFFSDIYKNCVLFAKVDHVFSLKKKQNIEKILEK